MAQIPDWMDELFAWADKNNISENKLPRDKGVAQIKTLNLEKQKIIELPNSIGGLVNLPKIPQSPVSSGRGCKEDRRSPALTFK